MDWLQTQIQNNPDNLFIQHREHQHSFAEVGSIVKSITRGLLKEGTQAGDRVIIYLPNGNEIVECILACFELGAITAPVSPMLAEKERRAVFEKIQPKLIITNRDHKSLDPRIPIPVCYIEELPNSASACTNSRITYEQNSDDVCAIILTSGTTGVPKAVQLTYGNFSASCSNWNNFLQFKKSDQFLCCLPLHHIGGMAVVIRALIYGFSVNLVSQFQAETVLKAIQQQPVTIISLVPTMLRRILELDGGLKALKILRWILLGGGPSPEYLLDLCIREKLNIVKVYGMSETCSGTVGLKLLDEPDNKLFAGRPFGEVKVWTENDEIHISGPVVMRGYLGGPETSGTHNSRDLGRLEDDGLLFLDVRRKDLIVTGGENVNPREVEEALMQINGILDGAVVGFPDDEWGQKVVAYVVNDESRIENCDIRSELKAKITGYKIPKEFISVPEIPRNEIGKIVYSKLRAL